MRLTAFEFIAATDQPQRVVLRQLDGTVILRLGVTGWIGVDLSAQNIVLRPTDLIIEGQGLGRPFWGEDRPSWAETFDPLNEAQRIAEIREAVEREINRARIMM